MRYTFRPLAAWTDPETSPRRSAAVFSVSWDTTLRRLIAEGDHLDATTLVVQVVVDEADLRLDGMLRTRAVVHHPGAVVSMDTPLGSLRFACDTYETRYHNGMPSWQANVRAIVLGLEALRAVDRWGVTKRGEQYTGWRAIGPGPATPMPARMTVEDAARYLLAAVGDPLTPSSLSAVITVPGTRQQVFRQAVRGLHPDVGGDPDLFKRVTEAKRVLDEHAGVTS